MFEHSRMEATRLLATRLLGGSAAELRSRWRRWSHRGAVLRAIPRL